ncbi:unnamed protein product [Macrosiphum euphorbiae]|uniref:Uncharacterized protein n=1 Tax=Macrosiphum euphorbiae TaxID=13131 RepID=A0AAV0X7A7_9HEMI|nr:unnamed protein product [Macrosiphum euphorbiae]
MSCSENQSVNFQSTETEVMQSVFAELRAARFHVSERKLLHFSRYVTGPASIGCRYRSLENVTEPFAINRRYRSEPNVTRPSAIGHLQSTPAEVCTLLCRGPNLAEPEDTVTAEQPPAEFSHEPSDNVTGPSAIGHLQSTPAEVCTLLCRGPILAEPEDTVTAEQPPAESSHEPSDNVTGPSAIGHLQSTPAEVCTLLCRGPNLAEPEDTVTAEQPPAESSHEPSDAESMGLVDLFDLQPDDHVCREIPLPPAGPSTSVDLVLVPDNVVEVPEVPPPSDDRTTRDETVPELPIVPAASSGQAELEPDTADRGRGDDDASRAMAAVDDPAAKSKKRTTLWRRTKRIVRRVFCCGV